MQKFCAETKYHYHSPTYAESIFQQRGQFVRLCEVLISEFQLKKNLGEEPCSYLHYLYTDHFLGKLYLTLDQNYLFSIPYPRVNCLKSIPIRGARTHIAYVWEYPPHTGVLPVINTAQGKIAADCGLTNRQIISTANLPYGS